MVLAICLRDVETPEAAFARYERLRRPRVEAIAAHARRNGARKAPPGPLALALRDLLLPLGLRLGARAQDRSYAHRISWEAPVG
jgi:2-polyprenyl-6-methoxyphenol hydroxylase-like FAD-dependent oxidoreductase